MKVGFIYVWRDRARNMYYVGSHIGLPDSTYVSSSQWMNGEYWFRPHDFRRKILVQNVPLRKLRKIEYSLIKQIAPAEFGRKYYNLRSGRKPGCNAWNKGVAMSEEAKKKLSASRKGIASWNKGKHDPSGAENGKKSADKVRAAALGRRREYRSDGTWYWVKRVEG